MIDHRVPLASMRRGGRGHVVHVIRDLTGRAERLSALGVTPGAAVHVLQTFPAIVFECDQTEIAVERALARAVLIQPAVER
jgi:Fe2+ transport system protein FeoA